MTTDEEKIFQEALSAIEENENPRAKDLLTRLLKMNQTNPDYWLWMSAVVSSEKERRYCLQQVLKLDPQNPSARRGLILLGDLPVDNNLRVPLARQQRKWSIPEIDGLENVKSGFPWIKIGLSIAALAIVVTLMVLAFTSDRMWIFRNRQVAVIGTAQSTPTFPATNTSTITPTPKYTGPTPPWMAIEQTYTPTPLYVNTPHAIIEAYRIAMRNYDRNDWSQAITYFQQAIEADKSAPDLPYLLGEVYRQNGQTDLALEAYNLSIEKDPNFAPPHLGRARILLLQNPERIDSVQEEVEAAIKIDPDFGEAYLELANIQMANNDINLAIKSLEKAEQLLPESPLVTLAMAKANIRLENYEYALELAIKANEQDRTNLESYRLLGQAYQANGQILESLEPLIVYTTHATTKDPIALSWLADAYAANGSQDEAIALYDEAILEDRFAIETYLKRGRMYLSLQENEKAFSDFEMAFSINPNSYPACMGLGEMLLIIDEPGDAYQQLSKCQKLSENQNQLARMYFYRALALEALGNNVAIQEWGRLLELPPSAIGPEFEATAQFYIRSHYTPTPSVTSLPTSTKTKTPTLVKSP